MIFLTKQTMHTGVRRDYLESYLLIIPTDKQPTNYIDREQMTSKSARHLLGHQPTERTEFPMILYCDHTTSSTTSMAPKNPSSSTFPCKVHYVPMTGFLMNQYTPHLLQICSVEFLMIVRETVHHQGNSAMSAHMTVNKLQKIM